MERGNKFRILRMKTILNFKNKFLKFPACCRFKWEITLAKKTPIIVRLNFRTIYSGFWCKWTKIQATNSTDEIVILSLSCYVMQVAWKTFVYWCYSHFQMASNRNLQWWLKIFSQTDCWSVCFVDIFSEFYWHF